MPNAIAAALEAANGRYAGSCRVLSPGDVCRVGARPGSELWLADDALVEASHCAVVRAPRGSVLHDLSAGGTFVNGTPVDAAAPAGASLRHGDWIVAGTSLVHYIERGGDEADVPTVTGAVSEWLGACHFLGEAPDGEPAGALLAELAEDWVPIGLSAVKIARFPASPDLRWFLRAVWGRGRGIFFAATAEVDALAEHFTAVAERVGAVRYFDPRILRTVLPECDAARWRELFGDAVHDVVMESQLPHSALRMGLLGGRVRAELRRFSRYRPPIPTQSEIAQALGSASPETVHATLAERLGVTPRELAAGQADWQQFGLTQAAACIQHELLCAMVGESIVRPELEALLPSARLPDDALDAFVTALNERRG